MSSLAANPSVMAKWGRPRPDLAALYGRIPPLRAVGDLAPIQRPPPGINALGVPGTPATQDAILWARRQIEKIRTAVGTGNLMFPAWLENHTDETPEIREHYHRMLSESTLKAAVGSKVLSVMGRDVQVHPDEPDDDRHKEAAELFRRHLGRIGKGARSPGATGTAKIAWGVLMPALINGWSICEVVWNDYPDWRGKGVGKWGYRDFKSKDARRLTPLVDEFKNLVGLRSNLDAGRVFAGDLLQDLVFYAHWGLYESPLGISDFRAAYRAWWIKNTARRLQGLNLDRFTGPFLVGKYAAADQRAALEEQLSAARAEGWLTIPVDAMVEVINLATGTNEVFVAAIESCDKEMLMGVMASHLQLMEGQDGNRAGDTTEHSKQGDLFTSFLADQLGCVISGQVAVPWYEKNYGDIEPATVTWGGAKSPDQLLKELDIDQKFQKLGGKLSRRDRQNAYGRTPPADPEDELKPEPQQPPPGMAGPGLPTPGAPAAARAHPDGEPYVARRGPRQGQPIGEVRNGHVVYHAEHDVSDEKRDADGRWTKGGSADGGAIKPQLAATAPAGAHKINGAPTEEHRALANRFVEAATGLSPEKKAEYGEHLAHALSVLPPGISKATIAAITHAQGGVRLHNDLTALRAEAEKIGGKSAKGVVGFANDRGMGTDVHLDGGDDPRGTYVHELWHAADNNGFLSDDKGWQAAYKKDILKGKNLLSRYALTNASEGFAEFGRALAEKGLAHMEAKFRNAVNHLRSKGLL